MALWRIVLDFDFNERLLCLRAAASKFVCILLLGTEWVGRMTGSRTGLVHGCTRGGACGPVEGLVGGYPRFADALLVFNSQLVEHRLLGPADGCAVDR